MAYLNPSVSHSERQPRRGGRSLVIAMAVCWPSIAGAQTDAVNAARFRLGPLGVTPSISIASGVDSNVLAEPTNPKSDMVTVANPRVQLWLRMRRLVVEVQNSTDATSFRQYREQSWLGTRNDVRMDLPINRVRLSATHSFTTTEQRANVEIDARARRRESSSTVGADIRATTKTFVRVAATASQLAFESEAANLGVNLAETLNRRTTRGSVALRYQATGATTVAMAVDMSREAFELAPSRDSTSIRLTPGIEFDPRAIISGRAYVGYRRFTITSGLAPAFKGVVAAIELNSVVREATRLGIQLSRDAAYSFDVTTPYYLMTGGGASVSRRLGARWEISVNASRQTLRYSGARAPAAGTVDEPAGGRRDVVSSYSGGLSFLFTDGVRIGFAVDRSQRESGLAVRGYRGTRYIAQFGYGS